MTGDQPLLAIPFVRKRVARLDHRTIIKFERVQTGVNRAIAVHFYRTAVDATDRFVLKKVYEIIYFLGRAQAWFIGKGRQQDRFV